MSISLIINLLIYAGFAYGGWWYRGRTGALPALEPEVQLLVDHLRARRAEAQKAAAEAAKAKFFAELTKPITPAS